MLQDQACHSAMRSAVCMCVGRLPMVRCFVHVTNLLILMDPAVLLVKNALWVGGCA